MIEYWTLGSMAVLSAVYGWMLLRARRELARERKQLEWTKHDPEFRQVPWSQH